MLVAVTHNALQQVAHSDGSPLFFVLHPFRVFAFEARHSVAARSWTRVCVIVLCEGVVCCVLCKVTVL
jgi:hypothetical protein